VTFTGFLFTIRKLKRFVSLKNIWRAPILLYICRGNYTKVEQMQLTKSEEQLMELIWKHEKVFMKDLLEYYPEPKPATTTIATLLKRMQDKKFIGYTMFGNSRQYYPLVKKTDYFTRHVKGIIKNYFNNSPMQFASFFTSATNLTKKELEDLKKIVDNEISKKKK
jgi:predicted transcriptional regulator